mmetsp:Transcript_29694/g.39657  ORF Transcript_29694/g.39657 Transcript_29694/m.39657 type:complete len:111 (+) Transcript_29694:1176-1508(+)
MFYIGTIQGNEDITFIPPWRRGRSPIKIKEFLRGQKVPLHRRPYAPVLFFENKTNKERVAIAVFVENSTAENTEMIPVEGKGKWVVHADFDGQGGENESNERVCVLVRPC